MAAYVQDKIELFKSIILNLGVRYEYFDPAAQYNPQPQRGTLATQDTIFLQENLTDASEKHMVSPRISVSYPDHRPGNDPVLVRALLPDRLALQPLQQPQLPRARRAPLRRSAIRT